MQGNRKIQKAKGMVQPSFTMGEIAPSLYGRVDFDGYYKGLRTCRNFIVSKYGGVYNRPGTEFIAEINDSSNKAYFMKFQFNNQQQYVLELGDYTMRIIANGSLVLDNSHSILVVTTPWAVADIPLLKFTQSADIITVCHPDYPPYQIKRYSATDWRIEAFDFKNGPFQDINIDKSITVYSSAVSGDVTLTASKPIFTADMVGLPFYIEQSPTYNTPAWEPEKTVNADDIVVYGTNYYQASTGGTTGTVPPTHTEGVQQDGHVGVLWAYLHSGFGIVTITGFTSTTVVTGTVVSRLPDGVVGGQITRTITRIGAESGMNVTLQITLSTPANLQVGDFFTITNTGQSVYDNKTWRITGKYSSTFYTFNFYGSVPLGPAPYVGTLTKGQDTYLWALPAWGSAMGWPAATSYFQNRQLFGGTPGAPFILDLSKSAGFNDFGQSNPLLDDDAIRLKFLSNQVNAIKHMVDLKYLIILTSGGIYRVVGGQNGNNVITPATIDFNSEDAEAVSDVPPIKINNYALYLQEKGNQVKSLGYNFSEDAFTGDDLTTMSNHLLQFNRIVRWTYQSVPYSCVWGVRDDGMLLGLTFVPKQQVIGWHRHDTLFGKIEDVCCVTEVDENGNYNDVVYLLVYRVFAKSHLDQPVNITGVTLSNPTGESGTYTLSYSG